MQHPMQQFHDMLETIITTGQRRPNRTGEDTLFIPGYMLKFDMADGFPAITTRKLAFKSAVGELLGFFRGYDSAADFRTLGCKVWDGNANETPAWLANPNRQGRHDYLGEIYGVQWNAWEDLRVVHSEQDAVRLKDSGYAALIWGQLDEKGRSSYVLRREINQLETALRTILTDPTNRRIIIDGWRLDKFDKMALPPCHVAYQFLVDPANGKLHMTLWQRSFDAALAFNISLGALFLEIMARLSGLVASGYTQFISDCHCYTSHIEGVKEMLLREHYPQPTLQISDRIKKVELDGIPGIFKTINPEDLWLENYQHHPQIKFKMAV
jgi:thymidylate synthase